jgi:hypothetical protein
MPYNPSTGRVASLSQTAAAMLLRRALPATRPISAHPFLFMRWVLGISSYLRNTRQEWPANKTADVPGHTNFGKK